jgi:hypothetical protein
MANISTDFSTWSATPASNQPDSLDTASIQADLQALQAALKIIFPNIGGAITPTHTELNYVDGVTSAIQTQLNAKAASGENSDITSLTAAAVTIAVDDKVIIQDTSASDALKTVTTQSIADLPIVSSTKTVGYGTGAGFEYTQTTSKSTDFTINRPCGRIITHNDALAAGASVSFYVNNSLMGSYNVVVLTGKAYSANYRIEVANSSTGGFGVRITNITAGSLSEAIIIDFAIIGVAVS